MTSTDISTSSSQFTISVDETFLNKMKSLVDKLRLENATLKHSLDLERSGVRALKAQQESTLRNLKTEYKKKEEFLEKQLRMTTKPEKPYEETQASNKLAELKRLTTEVQSLKSVNRGLQDKLKVAQASECARAAELRAQSACHAALERAASKEARAQCHKLLEEIKSKERLIIQLQREAARTASHEFDKAMECRGSDLSRKLRVDQRKDINREDIKTDIQHRKETFYREAPPSDEDSAVSSAPPSLSPQPHNDMWSCGQCRGAEERAAAAARECARLTDSLRDARDQLELMEFRLLELEDAQPDKSVRDNLTDTDSGCVSPGSRIKDSASPELKRMDSGYKSPLTPSSPCHARRNMAHDDFKEEFAKAQFLADILDRTSETDSLRSNPVKDHLEQMILNAESVEDRSCLEQVLMLLYNFQALSSSVSEDEFQVKPKKYSDLKIQKAIATVTPYSQQQRGCKSESLESLCNEEKKPNSVLQESGIFEEAETESIGTQTEVTDSFECSGELNTEIQRLNSIREKLERQGRNRSLGGKDDGEGLECRCVKLGKKHKQYYERRLKFLEGKISIYEAAQDVKKTKLSERLQKEFILENRVQELETQLSELQDKYERLEEECCELEEIENDTRLHWQQLEMDYELCSAQLRDMTEQRECTRAQADRTINELMIKQNNLRAREEELSSRLRELERAVPALIAWNVVQVMGAPALPRPKLPITCTYDKESIIAKYSTKVKGPEECACEISTNNMISNLDMQIIELIQEKKKMQEQSSAIMSQMEAKMKALEDEVQLLKQQAQTVELTRKQRENEITLKIKELESQLKTEIEAEKMPANIMMLKEIEELKRKERESEIRIGELEKREAAYLEMLTQADDMWADMEGGYKRKIDEAQQTEIKLKTKMVKLEAEHDELRQRELIPLKQKMKEVQAYEADLRVALEKSERDNARLKIEQESLTEMCEKAQVKISHSENQLVDLQNKFQQELEELRKMNRQLSSSLSMTKETAKKSEANFLNEFDAIRKQLNRSVKESQDLEVTNSELKEEVESLERQLALTQRSLSQCKRKCDEKIKTLSHELSIKTEELEELRSDTMRRSLHPSRTELQPDRTEYIDEGYAASRADYSRMHHSLGYIPTEARCSCPALRTHLVGQLIEDLFQRIHNVPDDDLTRLCDDVLLSGTKLHVTPETKAKITNYLLMAISKELVRSIGDADAKTDTEEWRRASWSLQSGAGGGAGSGAGVLHGAARLASVSCACAAARLCTAVPQLADHVKLCQEEVLDHSDVKIMEEQLANAIESIVNCPSCALGSNAIVWSTDV